ncbi:MAG: hypothetical protein HYW08_11410 [candidate division NC10 bacterium]|nr:hypothetical protein [candidate division NC10 bacterium]
MTLPRSRTLGHLLDEMAAVRPHAEAVVFRGQREAEHFVSVALSRMNATR